MIIRCDANADSDAEYMRHRDTNVGVGGSVDGLDAESTAATLTRTELLTVSIMRPCRANPTRARALILPCQMCT